MQLRRLTNPLDKNKAKKKSFIAGRTNAKSSGLRKFRLQAKNKLAWLQPKGLLPKVR